MDAAMSLVAGIDPAARSRSAARSLITPKLYSPGPARIDEALGEEVDALLLSWIEEVGLFRGELDKFYQFRFGRYAMLCHPDTEDKDRLLLAAKSFGAFFSLDDYYCDDERYGAVPVTAVEKLTLAMAAMEPAYLAGEYAAGLEHALCTDPVLVAIRSFMEHLRRYATPSQIARVRYEVMYLFMAMAGEATWRVNQTTPPTWEYLAQRQGNGFLANISLIDVVDGYEVAADLYFSPAVRKATVLASNATVYANDLYSAPKESMTELVAYNMPGLIAGERLCTLQEGLDRSAEIHDETVHAYEAVERSLLRDAPPLLRRYLEGLRAWIGGNAHWHATSGRYRIG